MTNLVLIKNCSIFAGLGEEELKMIAAECNERDFTIGTVIIEENEPPKEILYVVKEGEIIVSTSPTDRDESKDGDDCPALLSTFGPGEAFGEVSIIDSNPHSATVRALTDVKVIELHASNFFALVDKDKNIGFVVMTNIAKLICQRLRSSNFAVKHFGLWGKIDDLGA